MADDATFAPYRPIEFHVRGVFCSGDACEIHPDLMPLQFKVNKVHGTSKTVGEGERYVVEGEYELPDGPDFTRSLAVFTTSFGAGAHARPGKGKFSVSTEILELREDPPNGIGIVVGNDETGRGDIVRWVMLEE